MFKKNNKTVRFNNNVYICLIPTRHECIEETESNLWWSDYDFNSFKLSAVAEIRAVMLLQNITYDEAISKLYQSKNIEKPKHIEPTNSGLLVHI